MSTDRFVPVLKSYGAFVGAHPQTQRWLYTCPVGVRAEVRYLYGFVQDANPLAIGVASVFVTFTIGGIADNSISVSTRGAIGEYTVLEGPQFDLRSGDSIAGYSLNGGAGVFLRIQAIIREYQ